MCEYGRDAKFTLKVMTNNHSTKVLFAEANSDFVDVLVSFLTMPLGKIVRVLNNHYGENAPAIGKLTSLYNSLASLDASDHFWTEGCKEMLLNPTSSFEPDCRKLKLNLTETHRAGLFTCKNPRCRALRLMKLSCPSVYYDSGVCLCRKPLTKVLEDYSEATKGDGGVFTLKTMSFVISDDLKIMPNTAGFIQTLCNLGLSGTDIGETIIVTFGFNEIIDLLSRSLLSPCPLSDIIFNRGHVQYPRLRSEPGISFRNTEAAPNTKKIVLKVLVQKSTKKVLFCQSEEDFIDFLCSLLTIPLGGVECLLGGNTCIKSIDNLYKSITYPFILTEDIRVRLMKPNLPHGYLSENPILPLSEDSVSFPGYIRLSPTIHKEETVAMYSANFPKGQGKYVKGPRMYKISDDLTVTSFSMASTLSVLKELKIPITDVKELELEIRLEEALSILRASLTSTSALTNGLDINRMLMEQRS